MNYYIVSSDELTHHGILGQKWGVRRYQNPDGSLTPAGRKHLERQDTKWAKKNYNKIYKDAYKQSKGEIREAVSDLNRTIKKKNTNGKLSYTYINAYNQRLSQILNKNVTDLEAPSGRVVRFVAKRGDIGVHLALADAAYDMSQLKNGVYGSGRIAYRKEGVRVENTND